MFYADAITFKSLVGNEHRGAKSDCMWVCQMEQLELHSKRRTFFFFFAATLSATLDINWQNTNSLIRLDLKNKHVVYCQAI